MKNIVKEISQLVSFKDTTDIGDIVLIAAKEPQMLVYARIESIERDTTRKDEWWHVGMTTLTLPLQKISWTLRTEQLTGQEIFTMGGEERYLKAVDFGVHPVEVAQTKKNPPRSSVLKRIK